jgi:lysophospholipase L1-like esterase
MTESGRVIQRAKLRFVGGLLPCALLPCVLAAAPPARPATAAPAHPPSPAQAPAAPAALRFLALGDSYTSGERVLPAARWPVQLAALLRAAGLAVAEPEIVARTGWTVDDLAVALEESEPSGPYDLVSLQIGVNDEYRGRSAEIYRGELRVILRRAIAYAGGRPARVIVLSIPDWSVTPFAAHRSRPEIAADIERFNAVDREETARAGARYVDVTPESREAAKDPALLADDGLHPAPAMYAAWARLALAPALAALGADTARPPG